MKNIFDMPHYSMNETGLGQQLAQKMFLESKGDIMIRQLMFVVTVNDKIDFDVVNISKKIIPNSTSFASYSDDGCFIFGTYKGDDVLIECSFQTENDVSKVTLKIRSSMVAADEIRSAFNDAFSNEVLPSIKWWYRGDRGATTRDYYLPKSDIVLRPEFYPDLGDPSKFIKEYMESDEAVLLIAGPPGTGKTTLLRSLIMEYKLCAHVIYDESIMDNDTPFQSFLFGYRGRSRYPGDDEHGGDIMIIEDADHILTSRERDNNKMMSRFLNISDGLIKLPNKKLIFTTNITDFGTIDHALIRPGRCFGVMRTRELNLIEAQAAAKAAELPIPTEKREYTLAELFNQSNRTKVRQIGFGARH